MAYLLARNDDPAGVAFVPGCRFAHPGYDMHLVIARSVSDEAIHAFFAAIWIASLALAMTIPAGLSLLAIGLRCGRGIIEIPKIRPNL